MLFDTHAHLTDEAFEEDIADVIVSLKNMKVLNCGCDLQSSIKSVKLADENENFYAAVGVHPHDAKDYTKDIEKHLRMLTENSKVLAIGEIGLDYYYNYSDPITQKEVFIQQIRLANDLNLPIIIHSRDAVQDTYDIIKKNKNIIQSAVLHSFNQSKEMIKLYLDINMYFSISGPVTFKNADSLRSVIEYIPDDRLLIETDSPYLTPVPYRGKRNTPLNVEFVARKIAEIKNITYEEVCELTLQNAIKFFKL